MNKFRLYILLFTILSLFIVSCDKEKKDEIRIVVRGTVSFTGNYIYNGDTFVTFSGTSYYTQTFDDLDSINILVVLATPPAIYFLEVIIYRDNVFVKSSIITEESSENYINLIYNYDEVVESTTSS